MTSFESVSAWRTRVAWRPFDRLRSRGLALRVPIALAIVLIGAATLRYVVWAADFPLHHDEALYGYWARLIISGRDPFLLTAWVDKPPLVLYALAGALHWFGVSERALRLPGMVASLATIICTWGLARRLYDDRTAVVSAALLAFSPFAILFAPTAFTDPWLTLWTVLAVWAAVAGRPFGAGIAVGLALASKQQGVLIVPLVAALILAREHLRPQQPDHDDRRGRRSAVGRLRSAVGGLPSAVGARRFLVALFGFALIFAPVTWWDTLRWAKRPSFWDRSLTTYGGLGWAPPATWPDRAADWAQILGYWFGLPALTALMGGLALFAVLSERRTQRIGVWLAAFSAAYLALHLVIAFQPWDRYLLPLLPFVCLLAGRGIALIWHISVTQASGLRHPVPQASGLRHPVPQASGLRHPVPQAFSLRHPVPQASGLRYVTGPQARGLCYVPLAGRMIMRYIVAAALIFLLTWAAWLGAAARLPVGSDHGAYAGIERIASFLRGQPDDAIIYDRWLGWHFDFYLFDAPQERRWWSSAWKLADDAARTRGESPGRPQWVILPGWRDEAAAGVRLALAGRRLALIETWRVYRGDGSRAFTLYRIGDLAP